MADETYEQNLGQKSSLTTSDFIRVVGSDNASYKQSLSGVMNTMGVSDLNSMFRNLSWHLNADMNDFTTTGVYWIGSGPTNVPATGGWFPLVVMGRGDTLRQIIISYISYLEAAVFVRGYQSKAWSEWIKLPTRAEVDALNSKTCGQLTSNVGTLESWSYVRRAGNVVTLTFAMNTTQQVSSFTEIAKIPVGFRPIVSLNFFLPYVNNGNITYGQVQVMSDGAIRLSSTCEENKRQGFTVTYALPS